MTYPCKAEAGKYNKRSPGDVVNRSWSDLHNNDYDSQPGHSPEVESRKGQYGTYKHTSNSQILQTLGLVHVYE